jgi:hypothetical protein
VKEFLEKYNGGRLPQRQVVENVLRSMSVDFEHTGRAYDLLVAGLRDLGYLKEMNGNLFVQRPASAPPAAASVGTMDESDQEISEPDPTNTVQQEPVTPPPAPPGERWSADPGESRGYDARVWGRGSDLYGR